MPKKFLRRSWDRYSKLGKGRKKKQKWKRPTGRDNKMRDKRRGYPKVVSVGYVGDKKQRGKINGKEPFVIMNLKDFEKIKENQIVIMGSVGKKRKIEIAKKAKERKIKIHNLNTKEILRKHERKIKTAKPKEEKKKVEKNSKPKTELEGKSNEPK